MEFVINEWYLDWHRPTATAQEQSQARAFLQWLIASEHRIVLLRQSPFTQKLHTLRSDFPQFLMAQLHLKLFFSQVFENSVRCRVLEAPPDLSEEVETQLARPEEPPLHNLASDRYLFQSAAATEERIIVTTDTKLIARMNGVDNFRLIFADDFFAEHGIL